MIQLLLTHYYMKRHIHGGYVAILSFTLQSVLSGVYFRKCWQAQNVTPISKEKSNQY